MASSLPWPTVPAPVAAVIALVVALAMVSAALAEQLDDPLAEAQSRRVALAAAAQATAVLDDGLGLSHSIIVGQVRSAVVDLLRGSGLSADEARSALDGSDEQAGHAPVPD